MDYFTMARLAELNDFTEFAKVVKVANVTDDLMIYGISIHKGGERIDPNDFYAIQPKVEQSRVEWESRGRRPGR